jgi:CHAT domain-containing protein/tetratricopeptide (TPR) repeat protein
MKRIALLFFITIIVSTLQAQQKKILNKGHKEYQLAIKEGRYEDAYTTAYNCLNILKEMQPQRDSILGLSIFYLSETLYLNDRQEEALSYALQSKELIGKSYGKESINYALVLNSMAVIYSDLDEYDLAEDYSIEAIRVYKMHLPRKARDYFGAMCNLATLYDILDRYEEAKELYTFILEEYTLDKSKGLYTAVLMNLALLHENVGAYDLAEQAYLEVQTIFKENDKVQHPDYAALLTNMGILYHALERYEQTENLLLQAIQIFSKGQSGNFYDISSAYSTLAILYSDMGEYEKAEQYYLNTVELTEEFMGSESYDYAWSINNLGIYYEEIGAFEKAKEKYLEAQKIFLDIFGAKHTSHATSLSNLASVYAETNELDKSLQMTKKALDLLEEINTKRPTESMILINRISEIYYRKGNYARALDYAYRAIELNGGFLFEKEEINKVWCDTVLSQSFMSFINLNTSLELIERTLNRIETEQALQAKLSLVEMVMTIFEMRRNEYSTNTDKLYMLEQSTQWAERGILTIEKFRNHANWDTYKKQAFNFAEKNKSVLLTSDLQAEKAYSFGDLPDTLAQKEQMLQKEYDEYKAYLLDDITEEERQEVYTYLSDLLLEKAAFKEYIETNYPKYNQLKYAVNTISIEGIQETLGETTALLEYSVSDSAVTVFYIDHEQFQLYNFPIEYRILASNIALLHRTLSDYNALGKSPQKAHKRYTKVAYWFYENLVAAVLKEKKGIDKLVVVTDRELGHLPFETFLVEDGQNEQGYKDLHYLMNDYAISYDYSATLWNENLGKTKRSNNGKLLAMAAVYKQGSNTSKNVTRLPFYKEQRNLLGTLPAAVDEVKGLSQDFASDTAIGLDANERFFKERAADYGIIHLAMHGVLNRKSPILSSLVFTENNDSTENNFLQAYEISKLSLNANLVVLSACETGYGKFERGNGIASLARSFMYAGVPALVVSLWQVNDQSTAIVMRYFYENLSEGKSKAVALQAAKQRYISEAHGIHGHPAFWSSFVQLGNSEAIEWNKKSTPTRFWWILAGVLVVLGLLGALKWKKGENA